MQCVVFLGPHVPLKLVSDDCKVQLCGLHGLQGFETCKLCRASTFARMRNECWLLLRVMARHCYLHTVTVDDITGTSDDNIEILTVCQHNMHRDSHYFIV